MAASGLKDSGNVDTDKDQWDHLVRLTDFALALKEKLNMINGESFNNFALRIGRLICILSHVYFIGDFMGDSLH